MLMWITGIGAGLCLAYYIVIIIYAGLSASFSWIWLVAAAFLAAVSWGSRYCRLHPRKMPLWISVPAVTCLAAALAIFCVVEIFVFLGAASADRPGLDYVIVLGAKVRDEGISNSLRKRLDRAVEYGRQNPNTVFILSGGQGKDEPEAEAQAMYAYLLHQGIPASRLVMEPLAVSTVENIAYSSLIIERLENGRKNLTAPGDGPVAPGRYLQVEDRPVRIGILTSNFHVFRATMIAKKRGMENVYGIPAGSDVPLFLHLCVRECLAILKDRLMGNM